MENEFFFFNINLKKALEKIMYFVGKAKGFEVLIGSVRWGWDE